METNSLTLMAYVGALGVGLLVIAVLFIKDAKGGGTVKTKKPILPVPPKKTIFPKDLPPIPTPAAKPKKEESPKDDPAQDPQLPEKFKRLETLLNEKNIALEKAQKALDAEKNARKEFDRVKKLLEDEIQENKDKVKRLQKEVEDLKNAANSAAPATPDLPKQEPHKPEPAKPEPPKPEPPKPEPPKPEPPKPEPPKPEPPKPEPPKPEPPKPEPPKPEPPKAESKDNSTQTSDADDTEMKLLKDPLSEPRKDDNP